MVGIHRRHDWSDTPGVTSESFQSGRGVSVDSDDAPVGEASMSEGELFHVEQLGDGVPGMGSDVVAEVERLSGLASDLGGVLDSELGDDSDSDADRNLGARMFAHEVNNLVVGISGRAERALMSGDPAMAREALEMAAGIGARIRGLCGVFMEQRLDTVYSHLTHSEVYGAHEFAQIVASEYLGIVRVSWVVEVDESLGGFVGHGGVGGVPMGAGMFGQVLINLYRNALMGIGRRVMTGRGSLGRDGLEAHPTEGGEMEEGAAAGSVGGTIRLRVMGVGGGVVVRVEDSGVGFSGGEQQSSKSTKQRMMRERGDAESMSGGGYGLGLRVCRELCERCGGRVEVGDSAMLGGGRVDLVFGGKMGLATSH